MSCKTLNGRLALPLPRSSIRELEPARASILFRTKSPLFAVGTGFLADRLYGHMTLPFPFFETHGALQITACLIFLGLFVLRFRNDQRLPEGNLRSVYLLVAGIAVGLLFYGAHVGAQLSGRI